MLDCGFPRGELLFGQHPEVVGPYARGALIARGWVIEESGTEASGSLRNLVLRGEGCIPSITKTLLVTRRLALQPLLGRTRVTLALALGVSGGVLSDGVDPRYWYN